MAGRSEQDFTLMLMRRNHDLSVLVDRLEALSDIRLDLETIADAKGKLTESLSNEIIAALVLPLQGDLTANISALADGTEAGRYRYNDQILRRLVATFKPSVREIQARDWEIHADSADWDHVATILNSLDTVFFKLLRMGRVVQP